MRLILAVGMIEVAGNARGWGLGLDEACFERIRNPFLRMDEARPGDAISASTYRPRTS